MIIVPDNNTLARAANVYFIKRPVTDAAERMLKLLTRTKRGGLKAAPPPRPSPYIHSNTIHIIYTPMRSDPFHSSRTHF